MPWVADHFDLTTPAWLWGLAVVPFVVVAAAWGLTGLPRHRLRLAVVFRALALALVFVALAAPGYWRTSDARFVVFAVDRSESLGETGRRAAEEYLDKVESAKADTPVTYLAFAVKPRQPDSKRAKGTEAPKDEKDRLGTDLSAAVTAAAAAVPPGSRGHIVLLTDGVSTGPDPRPAVARCRLPVSVVPLPRRNEPNVQLAELNVPPQVREGEPFTVELIVASTRDSRGNVEVDVNGFKVKSAKGESSTAVTLTAGLNPMRFTVTPQGEGQFLRVSANLWGFTDDDYPDDNRATALAYCAGKPKVLIVSGGDPKDAQPLADALAAQQMAVDRVRPSDGLPTTPADYQPYDLVVLSNLDLTEKGVDRGRLEALGRYVRELGGGLLVAGGDRAFGPGGYARSPLEELLPVRCDIRDAREKATLALMFVIDKSGSMADGGKMDAARDAANQAVSTLGPNDLVGLVAFDTEPTKVCDLGTVVTRRAGFADVLRGVEPRGGTHILPGLQAGIASLRELGAAAKYKHILLLTDGDDNKESPSVVADYHALADEARGANIVITTLAVGREANKSVLADIANRTGGKTYATDDAREVPTIVVKTAADAGRRSVRDTPVKPVVARTTAVLAGIAWDTAPPLGGYTLTRRQDAAELVLTAEGDPLLAWWPVGFGTCAAFTSDATRKWGIEWVDEWPEYAKFWSQVARRTARRPEPPGVDVLVRRDADRATVTLDRVGPDGGFANGDVVKLTVRDNTAGRPVGVFDLPQVAPGRYAGGLPLDPRPGEYLFSLAVASPNGDRVLINRGHVVGYPAERRAGPVNELLMKELASLSGGRYDPTVEQLFADPGRAARTRVPLAAYLLAAAALLFAFDLACRRLPTGLAPGH